MDSRAFLWIIVLPENVWLYTPSRISCKFQWTHLQAVSEKRIDCTACHGVCIKAISTKCSWQWQGGGCADNRIHHRSLVCYPFMVTEFEWLRLVGKDHIPPYARWLTIVICFSTPLWLQTGMFRPTAPLDFRADSRAHVLYIKWPMVLGCWGHLMPFGPWKWQPLGDGGAFAPSFHTWVFTHGSTTRLKAFMRC